MQIPLSAPKMGATWVDFGLIYVILCTIVVICENPFAGDVSCARSDHLMRPIQALIALGALSRTGVRSAPFTLYRFLAAASNVPCRRRAGHLD